MVVSRNDQGTLGGNAGGFGTTATASDDKEGKLRSKKTKGVWKRKARG